MKVLIFVKHVCSPCGYVKQLRNSKPRHTGFCFGAMRNLSCECGHMSVDIPNTSKCEAPRGKAEAQKSWNETTADAGARETFFWLKLLAPSFVV